MTLGEVEVRTAVAADVEEVLRIERAAATAPHWSEAEYRAMVDRATGAGVRRCLYVACLKEALLGFAVGRVVGSAPDVEEEVQGEIESIAVRQTEQGHGIGRLLLDAVMGWCRGEGARAIELEVRAGGFLAQRLYARFGFEVTGLRRGYYSDPMEDAVLMRWVAE